MVAEVRGHRKQVRLDDGRMGAKQIGLQERHVRHDVLQMVLLWQHKNRLAHRRLNVLARRVFVFLARLWQQHLGIGNLEVAKKHLLNFSHIVKLRQQSRSLNNGLSLSKALGVAKD